MTVLADHKMIWLGIAALVFGAILFGILFLGRGPQFAAKALLTANELEFLGRLERAMPDLRFCPQVSMGAILQPAVARNHKRYMSIRGRFAQKIVDFVVQNKTTGSIICLVELDDRTHDAEKDRLRDAMTEEAGYVTVRWESRAKPSQAEIRTTLLEVIHRVSA
jgi:hypothetical protein